MLESGDCKTKNKKKKRDVSPEAVGEVCLLFQCDLIVDKQLDIISKTFGGDSYH